MAAPPRNPHAPKPKSRSNDKPWSQSRIRRATGLLKIVSNPTRLEILVLLGVEDRAVSALAKEIAGVSSQAISHNLSFLRVAGLIDSNVSRTARIYRLTDFGGRVVRAVGGLSGA